ncbi:hypothetical protein [Rubrobacter calidifluminis]|uniref:hypothetical protein n=1 Tax=Rubrobacter calidifluminis TaxID=1392640 RepID=UPI0023610B4E|nr:hypothetical protein [Rubrobacter calidifluminis]
MDYWYGFGTSLDLSQVYETTIADNGSGLSAHFIVVPSRSLGGNSYLYQDPDPLPERLGLLWLADIPLGRVTHSLAACLVSENVEEFTSRFEGLFERESAHPSVEMPAHFAFAEYLVFARVIPFEWSTPLSADSLGNILTTKGRGRSGYMYHGETSTPMLTVAIPEGMVICGSAPKLTQALEAGLRDQILEYVKSRSRKDRPEAER